jgi:hypothetical protein
MLEAQNAARELSFLLSSLLKTQDGADRVFRSVTMTLFNH